MSQVNKLYNLISDGLPHRTDEILREVYGGEHLGIARIGARIWDLRHKRGLHIRSWTDAEKPSLTWYQLQTQEVVRQVKRSIYVEHAAAAHQEALFSLRPSEH